jgi:hypothetical protein
MLSPLSNACKNGFTVTGIWAQDETAAVTLGNPPYQKIRSWFEASSLMADGRTLRRRSE